MKQIVISRIAGGLGNQLFCYAAARRLALTNNATLMLDIQSGFIGDYYKREYLLKHFNIHSEIASHYESYATICGNFRRRMAFHLNQFLKYENRAYISEEKPEFDDRLMSVKVKQKAYLSGCWQSEKYFKGIEDILRSDLEIISPTNSINAGLLDLIHNSNSVSIHYRSYAEVPQGHTAKGPDLCYYNDAINLIASKINNPHFFCFSDCPEWLKDNLKINHPSTIIAENGITSAIDDLKLMSHCNHHIIANSTFSWWGAWLSKNKEKIIIAPIKSINNKDFIPKNWLKI